jgi:hypothetical protein
MRKPPGGHTPTLFRPYLRPTTGPVGAENDGADRLDAVDAWLYARQAADNATLRPGRAMLAGCGSACMSAHACRRTMVWYPGP